MASIDSFLNVPLNITAVLGVIVFILLLIIRIRNIVMVSYVYFLSDLVITLGTAYSILTKEFFFYSASLASASFILIIYLIVKVFDKPQKREAKKAAKYAAEQASKGGDYVSEAALDALEEKYQRIMDTNWDLIAKLSSFFSSDNSMEGYLQYCNDLVSSRIMADGCIILIPDEDDNSLEVRSLEGVFPPPYKLPEDLPHKPIRVETNLRFAHFQAKDNIFVKIFSDGEPLLVTDWVKDPNIYQNGPEEFLKCGSYIFIPLKQIDKPVGLIALARKPDSPVFTNEEYEEAIMLCDAISSTMKPLYNFLSYAEHTELNKDGSIATKYQKTILPPNLPAVPLATIPNLSVGCFTNSVEGVCGDCYDIVVSRKDKISFVMTDVAGKGMNSLIIMIMIRAILRLAFNTEQTLSAIMAWANHTICMETSKIDHFASVSLLSYNAVSGEIQIASCGNNPIFHYKASDKSFSQVSRLSEPLGVTRDAQYQDINIKLESGDIIATCTDGLLECLNDNGMQYGLENLKKVILHNSKQNAKEISSRVKDDVKRFLGTAQKYDDQSLLVIKIL